MNNIKCVIFDWAGTTVDFGCFAPVNVFIDIFKSAGIEITMEEARLPMGMLKRDHIKAILKMERVRSLFEEKHGRDFNEKDVDNLYSEFEPKLMKTLRDFTDLNPYVLEVVDELRKRGIMIGSTTGYTDKMMEVVSREAEKKGYKPDFYITPDSTKSLGRPYPFMIYRNMEELKIMSPKEVIKVGDTNSDIQEGLNAGVWTIGVAIGSSNMGLSKDEYESLSKEEKVSKVDEVKRGFVREGANYAISSLKDLPRIIDRINNL